MAIELVLSIDAARRPPNSPRIACPCLARRTPRRHRRKRCRPRPRRGLGKLVLVALIWGGTFIAGASLARGRAGVGGAVALRGRRVAVVVATACSRAGCPVTARQWLGVSLLGATGVAAYNLCFMIGLQTVPASRASLIVALNPR